MKWWQRQLRLVAQTNLPGDRATAATARAKAEADATSLNLAEFRFTRAIDLDPLPWAEYLADPAMQTVHAFLSEAERKRIDKQIGTGVARPR
jgi:hypothetical protein